MEKSGHLSEEVRHRIVNEEIQEFKKLIKGHEKILRAIGEL